MSNPATETLSVTVEREMPYPPEKIWRALTQPHLIAEWLMKNDFAPVVGRQFSLRMDPQPNWNGVIDCQVLVVEPNKTLAYAWGALGLESVVTFTLTPTPAGRGFGSFRIKLHRPNPLILSFSPLGRRDAACTSRHLLEAPCI
jgi:uncharacterized protein YndB with AHSA1/START domain